MPLDENQVSSIELIILNAIETKLSKYNPETMNMPFHFNLIGRERMALYSFVHSLNTTLGVSIFEQIAKEIARKKFKKVEKQHKVGDEIYSVAQTTVDEIIQRLSQNIEAPNKESETRRIREVCQKGKIKNVKPIKADLYLENYEGKIYLIDLKTAKPNKGDFQKIKRTLLEWLAISLAKSPNSEINTLIAIPYNPYDPEPYTRWTVESMLDYEHELKVGEEFWDFIGGENTYSRLLRCFQDVGQIVNAQLEERFNQFGSK